MAEKQTRVVIGADHGGFKLKETIVKHLESTGCYVKDMGVHNEAPVDYPDISKAVCNEFQSGDYAFAVVLCGTGIGVSIVANKIKGIRCALVHDLFTAKMAKAHNNANVIAFGGRVTHTVPVERMLETYMRADFQGGRHERRVAKIVEMEQ